MRKKHFGGFQAIQVKTKNHACAGKEYGTDGPGAQMQPDAVQTDARAVKEGRLRSQAG